MTFDLKGAYDFSATPDEIWQAMVDPQALAACLPAVASIEKTDSDQMLIHFEKRFGFIPIRASVEVWIELEEVPKAWRVSARSTHKLIGMATAGADLTTKVLERESDPHEQGTQGKTRLSYEAFASLGEALIKILGRAYESRIEGWIVEFCEKFQQALDDKHAAARLNA